MEKKPLVIRNGYIGEIVTGDVLDPNALISIIDDSVSRADRTYSSQKIDFLLDRNKFSSVIQANSSSTLHQLEIDSVGSIKWTVNIIDVINRKIRSFDVNVLVMFNESIKFNVSSILGDNLNIKVDVIFQSSVLKLILINNLNYELLAKGFYLTSF